MLYATLLLRPMDIGNLKTRVRNLLVLKLLKRAPIPDDRQFSVPYTHL